MQLVIVESPTKAKTIGRFLGKGYVVESSYGHVRDLPKSRLGVDVEKNFEPKYTVPKKAKDVVKKLTDVAKKASTVVLATDEDREGEAIAWHLVHALGLNKINKSGKSKKPNISISRIAFHEITESAIKEALKSPREIDMNLVNAQQARRILDRLVGYGLSPFIWRKVRYGLSAGRVQSVTLRLIIEREREISAFKKDEYWTIEADLVKREKGVEKKDKKTFRAKLHAIDEKTIGKLDVKTGEEAEKILKDAEKKEYKVLSVSKRDTSRNPAAPFTTSTLQQEAARKFGFSAKQTMMVAQRLYEEGFITYMRTDSTNLSSQALTQTLTVIKESFGENYTLDTPRVYAKKSKGAQEAHEAIRPTNLMKKSGAELGTSERNKQKLYEIIWKRTVASQMRSAEFEQTTVNITSSDNKYTFRAGGQVVKFDGFIKVYTEGQDEPEEEYGGTLPELVEGDETNLEKISPSQHFTEPPPRYTDATLVKTLEAHGIGRPSTYAPTLSTIQNRGYVEKLEKKYHPTEIGFVVNDLLVEHFPEIVDVNFTSHIEEEFDNVAEGKTRWNNVCAEFYGPFKKHLDEKEEEVKKHIEISETPCPHCGKPMIVKFGRMGKFLACSDPEVKVTLPMPEEQAKIRELEEQTKGEHCPICGKKMKVKRSRFGYFLGCESYPECKGMGKIFNKIGFKCPTCLESADRKENPGDVVEKKSRGRGKLFYACSRWPDCDFIINKKPENEAELEELFKNFKKKKVEKSKEAKKESEKKTPTSGERRQTKK